MDQPLALIVDNNKRRRTALGRALQRIDLNSRCVSSLGEAKDTVSRERYQLITIRLEGDKRKAYSFCRLVHRADPVPIIVALLPEIDVKTENRLFDSGVTAVAAAEQTNPSALLKRIVPHLRPQLERLSRQNWARLHTTWVNFDRHEAWCSGELRRLPGNLATLLHYFLEHPDQTVSRQDLYESDIWQRSVVGPDRGGKALDMAVSKLRKIIEPDPQHPQIILSVRGRGFKLAPDI